MDPRDFDTLRTFLATVGAADLFDYLKLERGASGDAAAAAIKKRRGWAQGQQSNPKYRQEALWVIKNVKLLRTALIDQRAAYIAELDGRDHARKADILRPFIQGAIAEGVLTSRAESAILDQGAALGLDEDATMRILDEMVEQYGARRATHSIPTDLDTFTDHYAVLGVTQDADLAAIEQAYQARYSAARQLPDPAQAEAQYARIDAAWATLKAPASRAAYDARWQDELQATATTLPPDDAPDEPPELEASPTPFRLKDTPADAGNRTLSLQDGPPPTPTDLGQKRTLDLGDGSAPVRVSSGPRIQIEGDETRSLDLGKTPHVETLTVRKVGKGRLKARASCTPSEWASVSPELLSSTAAEQPLKVTIDPSKMPGTSGTVRVVVASGLNDRHTVTIAVTRPRSLPVGAISGGLLLAGAAAAAAVVLPDLLSPPPPPAAPSATLAVRIDPPFGEVWVDGELRSSEGALTLREGLTEAGPVNVLVRREGFAEWSREVPLTPGETSTVEARLELRDPMDFHPEDDQVEGTLDAREATKRIGARKAALDQCLLDHARVEPGERYTLELDALVTPSGSIRGTRMTADPPPSKALTACLHRELRAIPLPMFQGDYATHRTTLSVVTAAPETP